MKGKQATIDAGTVIMVETMDDVTLNTFNFIEKEIDLAEISKEDHINEAPIQKKVIEKPKPNDFKSSSEYQKARREYYKSIEDK